MSDRDSLLHALDAARHRIPFWWWLTYDALVGVVILLGFFGFRDATLWLGFAVLFIAVAIDTIEFIVKRPSARAKLATRVAEPIPAQHPRAFEDAVLRLIHAAEQVNENVMASGLAYRRDALRDEILYVRSLIEDERANRRAALRASA